MSEKNLPEILICQRFEPQQSQSFFDT